MKKVYLTLFLSATLPFILTAQQKNIVRQTQVQATPHILPPAKNTEPHSQTSLPVIKEPAATVAGNTGKNQPAKTQKRKVSATIYGNEWVSFSKKYYKIKVAKDGIYRVDSLTLAKAGIPVKNIDGRNFQLYFRGVEQYLYVKCKNDTLRGINGDYVEFYGQQNDGIPDSTLYYKTDTIPNPYYSLYNDTSTYYLTWNAGLTNNRMVEQYDTAWSLYNPAPFITASTLALRHTWYMAGMWYPSGGLTPNDPRFNYNSTWTSDGIIYNSGDTLRPNVSNIYIGPNAPAAKLRTEVIGINYGNITFTISDNSRVLLNSYPCNGFGLYDGYLYIPPTDLTVPGFAITYYNNATTNTNIITRTFAYLTYPHTLNLGGTVSFMMNLKDSNAITKTYLNLSNISTGVLRIHDTVWMYDLTNHNRYWVKNDPGGYKVNINNSGGLKQCYLVSDSVVNWVTNLTPVGHNKSGLFTDFNSGKANAYIIITHRSLWNGANNYAAYRRSTGFNTVVADVDELYDQFGDGVYYSPLGIRRFCNYAYDKWATPPSNLFIIGKGIHSWNYRKDTTLATIATRTEALVPSFGYPSSDILFTNNFDGDSLKPCIPTGRLAAQTEGDIATYLSKVNTYEHTPAALWMKKVAHFSGGADYLEAHLYSSWLDEYAQMIEDTLFGAKVFSFQKSTSAPISTTLTDSIVNLINGGVSIMNFFGHAGGSDWDESVDFAKDYSNYGKYPFMIADACYSGDIYQPVGDAISSVSEDWVLNPPGAIAFLASDFLGDAPTLRDYTRILYQNISHRPGYRKSIGMDIQNTIEAFQNNNPYISLTCQEMTLHGDPAIVLSGMTSKPDYAVDNQSITFSPANVTVLDSTFVVNVTAYNYGEALDQTVAGVLTRTFPNGMTQTYPLTFKNLNYEVTVSDTLPVDLVNGPGLNYFSVSINLTPIIDSELTYSNNTINNVPLWITSEAITPIWPYDFAIIPNDTVTLKAYTDDPFAPSRTYIFEIDTSHSFNSPLHRSHLVTSRGGVVKVSPYDWNPLDDTTHYKRPLKGGAGSNTEENIMPEMKMIGGKNFGENPSKTIGKTTTPAKGNNAVNSGLRLQNPTPIMNQQAIGATHLAQPKMFPAQKENSVFNKPHGPIDIPPFINGKVYYWRVRRDSATYQWANSSFQYIKGKNGWGQSDYYQYINDEQFVDRYNFIQYNNPPRDWTFNTNGHKLECFTFGMPMNNLNGTNLYATEYKIDNFVQGYAGCDEHYEIDIAVIDPVTLQPWTTDVHPGLGYFNVYGGGCTQTRMFIYWTDDPGQTSGLVNMLKTLQNNYKGYYLLAWSWINGQYKAPNLTNADSVVAEFNRLGCTQMPSHAVIGQDSVPFIFFTQIGNPASSKQVFGKKDIANNLDTSSISLGVNLNGTLTYGAITTPFIGPAKKYDSLSWSQHSYDKSAGDSTRLSVIGIESTGNTKILMSNVTPATANFYISSINATLYPYIQVQLYTKDTTHHTPAQMDWWRVFYQPVPEIAINPNILPVKYDYYHADTLMYGDTLRFKTVVQNISDWPIDSTFLLTWTMDSKNKQTFINSPQTNKMVKALKPGDTALVSMYLPQPPSNSNALNSIWFEVNPENYPSPFSQTKLEQYHFNDYAKKSYYVYGDKINPVLDVTFDGIHILNNDIVSPQPQILISCMDENKFLALNDPSAFNITYRNINSTTTYTITTGPELAFTPASMPHNKCNFLWTPKLADGTYELTVQGKDRSGNFSANNTYKIDFKVVNKSMISEVLNYPNPFTTSTKFVFILTGDQIPTSFKIQIMTVTGKIVKEINENEIGPIHIGRNITQYAWDGTDQYGSKLANGVYLYRVISTIYGQNIDDYQTGADQYFTKGWGKMYLMR